MQFQPSINRLKTFSYVLGVPVDYLIYNDACTHDNGEYWRQRTEFEHFANAFLAKCPWEGNASCGKLDRDGW